MEAYGQHYSNRWLFPGLPELEMPCASSGSSPLFTGEETCFMGEEQKSDLAKVT